MIINRKLSDAQYGTHMAPLVTAVMNTTGPVLEMGCGDYSTPILHAICETQQRELLSTDTSKVWLELFLDLKTDYHKFSYIPVYEDDWETKPKPYLWDMVGNDKMWGVVFIDHRPGDRRSVDVTRMASKSQIIVVHDTENLDYNYESAFKDFTYRHDYKRYNVYTTLVSNTIDVRKLFTDL